MLVVEPLSAHPEAADAAPGTAADFFGKGGRKAGYSLTRIKQECSALPIHSGMDDRLGAKIRL